MSEHAATISRRLACSLHSGKQLFLPRVGWFGRDGAKTGILGSLWGARERVPLFFLAGLHLLDSQGIRHREKHTRAQLYLRGHWRG